jgi:type VI secretion system protein ImpI
MQLLLTLNNAETFGVTEAEKLVSGSLSIGRGKQAGWALPDATRMLSSVHCEIKAQKRGYTLTDFSRNGTRLNGSTLVRMHPTPISSGDQIEIGPYLIAVSGNAWGVHVDEKTVVTKHALPDVHGEKTIVVKFIPSAKRTIEDQIPPATQKKVKPTAGLQQSSQNTRSGKTSSRRFVEAFCEGAALDPENFAGRSDLEFARELGMIMRNIVGGVFEISHLIGELRTVIGSSEKSVATPLENTVQTTNATEKRKQVERLMTLYFGNLRADDPTTDEPLGAAVDEAVRHNRALFFAMQTALFRLLNELSPTTIEQDTKTTLIRSKSAKNWNSYLRKWENLNTGGEDGMLDVFLRYFGEAYDIKMQHL